MSTVVAHPARAQRLEEMLTANLQQHLEGCPDLLESVIARLEHLSTLGGSRGCADLLGPMRWALTELRRLSEDPAIGRPEGQAVLSTLLLVVTTVSQQLAQTQLSPGSPAPG